VIFFLAAGLERIMSRAIDLATSFAATLAGGGAGAFIGDLGRRPERLLELYEFEACPFCRKVREALSVLDLDAMVYPCPKGGERYRPLVVRRGGKAQFPFLVDPNQGKEMYESDDIIAYLFARYGTGSAPWFLGISAVATTSAMLASALRPGAGGRRRPARAPDQPLDLWSFEASPYCRLVREELSSLELPYRLHNVAKGSGKRADLVARGGKMQVPYLADPNTGREMYESADIVAYLRETYALDRSAAAGEAA
jgi:glutathione S-transferase